MQARIRDYTANGLTKLHDDRLLSLIDHECGASRYQRCEREENGKDSILIHCVASAF